MKKTSTSAVILSLALTTACLFSTQVHHLWAADATTPAWTDQCAISAMDTNKKWQQDRWSKSERICRNGVNELLEAGATADVWQYERLANFANLMQTCNLLAISVEGTTLFVTDKDNRVFALDGLLDTYRVSIRVRINGVRDGLQTMRKFSRIPDVRQAADEMFKMVNEYDKNVVTARVRELEQLQRTVGRPPKSAITK